MPKSKAFGKQMTMRVLIVCDRPNWAYDAIAKALIKYNHDPFLDFDVAYTKGGDVPLKTIYEDYDVVFAMGWQLLGELRRERLAQLLPFVNAKIAERFSFLDPKRTLTGIHSHHAWDNQQTSPTTTFSHLDT
jgi:hypothetical protein